MSILLQQKNVGDYSHMSSPNIYYRAQKNVGDYSHMSSPNIYYRAKFKTLFDAPLETELASVQIKIHLNAIPMTY